MNDGRNLDYYRRREAQERAIAARTDDVMSRRLHLELADRYAALVAMTVQAMPTPAAA